MRKFYHVSTENFVDIIEKKSKKGEENKKMNTQMLDLDALFDKELDATKESLRIERYVKEKRQQQIRQEQEKHRAHLQKLLTDASANLMVALGCSPRLEAEIRWRSRDTASFQLTLFKCPDSPYSVRLEKSGTELITVIICKEVAHSPCERVQQDKLHGVPMSVGTLLENMNSPEGATVVCARAIAKIS